MSQTVIIRLAWHISAVRVRRITTCNFPVTKWFPSAKICFANFQFNRIFTEKCALVCAVVILAFLRIEKVEDFMPVWREIRPNWRPWGSATVCVLHAYRVSLRVSVNPRPSRYTYQREKNTFCACFFTLIRVPWGSRVATTPLLQTRPPYQGEELSVTSFAQKVLPTAKLAQKKIALSKKVWK